MRQIHAHLLLVFMAAGGLGSCSSSGGSDGAGTPAAEFSGAPLAGTAPLDVDFLDLSTGGITSWSWAFGDGATSNVQSPSHTYAAAGTYTVSLTVTDATGMDTETKTAYVTVTAAGVDTTPPMITCPADQIVPGFVTDEFAGAALDAAWMLHNPGLMQFSVSGGELHVQPTMNDLWFQDQEGPLIYRNVTGDFTATATLRAEDLNNPGNPPPVGPGTTPRLGGLIARDPASAPGDRNSVHAVLGSGGAADPVVAEDKSTDGSVSDFAFLSLAQPQGEVRIVRTGSLFSLEYRAPGAGSFQVLRTHDRPDLPATLQVGPMVYSSATPPDLIVHFDQVTIASANVVVAYPPPTATDDTDPAPVVVCTPPAGSAFPAGTTMVDCTATDASGNSAMCSFAVTVTMPAPLIADPARTGNQRPRGALFLRSFPVPRPGAELERPHALDVIYRD